MSGVEHVEVRSGAYHDSVTLMQASKAVAGGPGVQAAQLAMGTDLNLDVLGAMGFSLPPGVGPNDLVIALRARDEAALAASLASVAGVLAPRRGAGAASAASGSSGAVAPRTTRSAARTLEATLALISLPGQHAFTEALDALESGLHVMVFSDNVAVEQEVRLKDEGAARGLLVMGPDCGTAVVGGVGLGFANVVAPGPVGIVAASGTGAQQVMCLLDHAGVGVTACLGVGGRDLSAAVGGRSTKAALALLDAEPGCELIVVVSKPPDARIESELLTFAGTLRTPVQFGVLGMGRRDLTATARAAVEAVGRSWDEPAWWPSPVERHGRYGLVRGAFSGGTLCDEAMVIASAALGPIASNIPLDGAPSLGLDAILGATPAGGHVMVDFGDDELTRGRPHPMIDGSLRAEWLVRQGREAGSPAAGAVLLLDVVLGHGAHPDPASELAPALLAAHEAAADRGVELAVVASLCGTTGDPQQLEAQARALVAAGASVHLSNAAAARKAVALIGGGVDG